MELIELIFKYKGAVMEAEIHPEENCNGMLYLVELNGDYSFTMCFSDKKGWSMMRENDRIIPAVDDELFVAISRLLKWELSHAA
jgi:hypothetical protein